MPEKNESRSYQKVGLVIAVGIALAAAVVSLILKENNPHPLSKH